MVVNRVGSMMTFFFNDFGEVYNYQTAVKSDTSKYASCFKSMLSQGFYFAPSQFECTFVSAAQSFLQLEDAAEANRIALKNL